MIEEKKHARLSASGSHMWMACPASIQMGEDIPEQPSDFAAEGTKAHEVAEKCLRDEIDACEFSEFPVDGSMQEHVQTYLDYVRKFNGEMFVEQRVDFSRWVPDGFGTADCIIIIGETMHVIDLKYGKGVPVSAKGNSQLRLYGIGAAEHYTKLFEEVNKVVMHVVQPRIENFDTEEIALDELYKWADEVVRPAAELALSSNPPVNPGEKQCRFCRARQVCKARAQAMEQIAYEAFSEPLLDCRKMTYAEIGALLPKLDDMIRWATEIQNYALQITEDGEKLPGWKLVAGRAVRRWKDDDLVVMAMKDEGLTDDQIYTKKLIGIGEAEKLLGKKHQLIADLAVKGQPKPTLVQESDPRPELFRSDGSEFSA